MEESDQIFFFIFIHEPAVDPHLPDSPSALGANNGMPNPPPWHHHSNASDPSLNTHTPPQLPSKKCHQASRPSGHHPHPPL
mmetsp:Transcript_6483/g.14321  ORF Transcript_6483/g.14321 Transcript_6483/m.14321 type:complete len:81 (+) Transcript_6483:61-303(+)